MLVTCTTPYDVLFSHNIKHYRQTTDGRQTDDTSYHKRDFVRDLAANPNELTANLVADYITKR